MKHSENITLTISGMTCEHCAGTVKKALMGVPGAKNASVDFASGKAEVQGEISSEELIHAVRASGYRVETLDRSDGNSIRNGGNGKNPNLIILGGGSAAFAAAIKAHELGARVTIVNDGLPIGGTCVNVGCVPSKNLIRAAEALHRASHPGFPGIEARAKLSDFGAIMAQKRELVEQLRQAKYLDVVSDLPGVKILSGHGRLLDPRTVEIDGEKLRSEKILLATGASPVIPPVPGLEEAGVLTSKEALELDHLPKAIIILGGRYIALELAQMFARFGSGVTLLQRSDRILPAESSDLTERLTVYLSGEGIEVITGVTLVSAERTGDQVIIGAEVNGKPRAFRANKVIAATGRRPNTKGIQADKAAVELTAEGAIKVNETLQTSVPNIYAAGDVIGPPQFVYTAAYEGALAAENALRGSGRSRDYAALPWVIFTDPQLAGVGMALEEARTSGIDAEAATLPMEHVPRALAARDTRGMVTLIRDRTNDKILGGRILAPEGGETIMEVSLAIKHGMTARELATAFHPYLTNSEAIKLCAITFGKDVGRLSCCAS